MTSTNFIFVKYILLEVLLLEVQTNYNLTEGICQKDVTHNTNFYVLEYFYAINLDKNTGKTLDALIAYNKKYVVLIYVTAKKHRARKT